MEDLKDSIARCVSLALSFAFGATAVISVVAGLFINPWWLVSAILSCVFCGVSIGICCFLDTNSLSDLKERRNKNA